MKKFLTSMFQDERGAVSHKRMIGTLCTVILCIALITKVTVSETLVHAVEGIAIACIVGTTLDKFSFKESSLTKENGNS